MQEELSAQGAGLLLVVVSPAICGTIIGKYGTDEQKQQWLPGLADGSKIMAFGITEADAGSNSHQITTTRARDGDDWILSGSKVYISGVDQADAVLIVARTEDAKTGKLKPALFIVPTDTPGFVKTPMEMDIIEPDHQFILFLDEVRLPPTALVGEPEAALMQLFAGPEPRAHPGCGDGCRNGPLRDRLGGEVRQGTHGVEDADRCAPGHLASAGAGARSSSNSPN